MEITEETKQKGALIFLYIGKLIEFGIIEPDGPAQLTPKGFDLAMDVYESGVRLTDTDILDFLHSTPGMSDEVIEEGMFALIKDLQEIGFDEMKKRIEEIKLQLE